MGGNTGGVARVAVVVCDSSWYALLLAARTWWWGPQPAHHDVRLRGSAKEMAHDARQMPPRLFMTQLRRRPNRLECFVAQPVCQSPPLLTAVLPPAKVSCLAGTRHPIHESVKFNRPYVCCYHGHVGHGRCCKPPPPGGYGGRPSTPPAFFCRLSARAAVGVRITGANRNACTRWSPTPF